jgi:hypothetical protein
MTLGELIAVLKAEDQALVVPRGFAHPHSYRGYYFQLAFEPSENVTVGSMLADAENAVGAVFTGWKGGNYTMSEHTKVWLAHRGNCGEEIGPTLLKLMLSEANASRASAPADQRSMVNPHDQETIDVYERAQLHIGGGCGCPERLSDGPSQPECLRALELACAASQDEILDALGKARHEVWVASMLHGAQKRIEQLEARLAALEGKP